MRLQYQAKLDQNALLCQKWEVGGSLREIKKVKVFEMDFTWWFADTVLSIRSRDIVAEFKLSGFVDTTKLKIYYKRLLIQSADKSLQKLAFVKLVECCIKLSFHPKHVLVSTVCFFIHLLTLWWSSMACILLKPDIFCSSSLLKKFLFGSIWALSNSLDPPPPLSNRQTWKKCSKLSWQAFTPPPPPFRQCPLETTHLKWSFPYH